jgi:hypothetical protein
MFEADGHEVWVGEVIARRADDEPAFANALRVVVTALKDYDEGIDPAEPVKGAVVLSVASAKLSNMTQEQLSWVSKLEDVIDPAKIVVIHPAGKGKPPLAFEDTPANREAITELIEKLGEPPTA